MTHDTIGKERRRYLNSFTKQQRKEALKAAIEVRKSEFELYWKRAAFGMALIGVAFAGYFALQKDGGSVAKFAVGCLGLLATVAWYCINRGSAASLRNWEIHVEILEDEFIGPLFKRVMGRRFSFWKLVLPYPYSPQRINNIVALALVLVWLLLLVWTVLSASVVQGAGAVAVASAWLSAMLTNISPGTLSTATVVNLSIVILLSIATLAAAIYILCAVTKVPENYKVEMDIKDRKFSDDP